MEISQPFNLSLPLSVSNGGTGRSSFTAYAVITGGTTSTGALQNVSGLGTSGQVLTSNGASALPSWQTITASGNVVGPASSTLNAIPRYANTTGKLLGNSTIPARLDNNGVFQDNGINGTVGKSIDPINHVLWSGDTGTGSVPVFDFTGNGGGGTTTAGSRLVYARGEDMFSFFVPLADHDYNVALDTNSRIAYGSVAATGGAAMFSWYGPNFNIFATMDMGGNGISNIASLGGVAGIIDVADELYMQNQITMNNNNISMSSGSSITDGSSISIDAYNRILSTGLATMIDYSGTPNNVPLSFDNNNGFVEFYNGQILITNGGQVAASSFSGDGSLLGNLTYANISGVPMAGNGTMQTGLDMNGNTFTLGASVVSGLATDPSGLPTGAFFVTDIATAIANNYNVICQA